MDRECTEKYESTLHPGRCFFDFFFLGGMGMVYVSAKGFRGALPGARVSQKQIRKKYTSPFFLSLRNGFGFGLQRRNDPNPPLPPYLLMHATVLGYVLQSDGGRKGGGDSSPQ